MMVKGGSAICTKNFNKAFSRQNPVWVGRNFVFVTMDFHFIFTTDYFNIIEMKQEGDLTIIPNSFIKSI